MKFSLNFALIATSVIFAFAIDGYMADCPNGVENRAASCWFNNWSKIELATSLNYWFSWNLIWFFLQE